MDTLRIIYLRSLFTITRYLPMDFLKEIEPHNERLDAYQKNKTFSGDVNALRDLARIYNKYVYQGKGDVKANLACGQCKAKMIDF